MTGRAPGARTIDEILAAARARLVRLSPRQAFRELSGDGVLVDIRPAAQRAAQGEIPGSTVVERNHLEWRLDPCSDARLPWVTGYDHRIIVFCVDGYTSSLAAAALRGGPDVDEHAVAGQFAEGLPRRQADQAGARRGQDLVDGPGARRPDGHHAEGPSVLSLTSPPGASS